MRAQVRGVLVKLMNDPWKMSWMGAARRWDQVNPSADGLGSPGEMPFLAVRPKTPGHVARLDLDRVLNRQWPPAIPSPPTHSLPLPLPDSNLVLVSLRPRQRFNVKLVETSLGTKTTFFFPLTSTTSTSTCTSYVASTPIPIPIRVPSSRIVSGIQYH